MLNRRLPVIADKVSLSSVQVYLQRWPIVLIKRVEFYRLPVIKHLIRVQVYRQRWPIVPIKRVQFYRLPVIKHLTVLDRQVLSIWRSWTISQMLCTF